MPTKISVASALAGLCLVFAAAPAAARALDSDVLAEINFARTQPRQYARELQRSEVAWRPQDGYARDDGGDVAEAVEFLMRQQPLPPLRWDERLASAAHDHAASQGPRGSLGHVSPGGATLGQRLQRRGLFASTSAENISYGYDDPAGVVRQLIVDSGVPSRGHRHNIFGNYQAAGVGCGDHARYGSMCVIDFAGAIQGR